MYASCVLPKKVGKIVWVSCQFSFEVVILVYYCNIKQQCRRKQAGSTQEACRKHAGSTHHPIKAEWGTHTKKATFLGSTHGCFLRASFCCIINGSNCMYNYVLSNLHSTGLPNNFTNLWSSSWWHDEEILLLVETAAQIVHIHNT